MQPENLIITKTAGGYHKVTYLEHMARTKQLASALEGWGLRIGDAVGTLMWNSSVHLHCYHALSCMGAILHTLNLRLGPQDLSYIVEHGEDRVIITDASMLPLIAQFSDSTLSQVELILVNQDDFIPGQWQAPAKLVEKCMDFETFLVTGSEEFTWPDLPETAVHALCHTSGTTGLPKGVAFSQRSTYLHTMGMLGASQCGFRPEMVVLPMVPMFHVLCWSVPFCALTLGLRLVFTGRFTDPASVLQCYVDQKVEVTLGVPAVWQGVRALVEQLGLEKVRPSLANLRLILSGGSAPATEMMAWFRANLGVDFQQAWGMTELNPLGTIARQVGSFRDLAKSDAELHVNVTKAGLASPGVELRIANPEALSEDQPRGEPGELLARGPWVIQEYYKNPATERFFNGWLITGDIAKIDEEGAIVICDRSKDVIKSGGEWISSIDMENAVTGMPEIVMAAVVAAPHPKWDERPIVIVVLAPGADAIGLHEKVNKHLSALFTKWQLPDDILVWPEIPMTSTGKIDKKVIRGRLKEQAYVLPDQRQSKL